MVLSLLMSGNAYAKTGKGELKLTKETMKHFLMYLYGSSNPKYSEGKNKKNNPLVMTVSKNGKMSHYYYCPWTITQCQDDPTNYGNLSIIECEKRSNGSPCYVFAKGRRIVWKNGIKSKSRNVKRKLLKEPYQIVKIVQDLGFYEGDISQLPRIDYDTANIIDDEKITGKKEVKKLKIKKKAILLTR